MLHNTRFRYISKHLLVIGLLVLVSANTFAQKTKTGDFNLSENAIKNLNMGIQSENTGLKTNAIYFAGLYLVDESAETLVNQLRVEEDPKIRILITKVLYLIDNEKFIREIKKLAVNDEDENVKEFAKKIYSIIQLEKSLHVADLNN